MAIIHRRRTLAPAYAGKMAMDVEVGDGLLHRLLELSPKEVT
jgi:hypothetical protein